MAGSSRGNTTSNSSQDFAIALDFPIALLNGLSSGSNLPILVNLSLRGGEVPNSPRGTKQHAGGDASAPGFPADAAACAVSEPLVE